MQQIQAPGLHLGGEADGQGPLGAGPAVAVERTPDRGGNDLGQRTDALGQIEPRETSFGDHCPNVWMVQDDEIVATREFPNGLRFEALTDSAVSVDPHA